MREAKSKNTVYSRHDDDDVYYPRGRRPRGENKKRKATKSKGRGRGEGASRALMRHEFVLILRTSSSNLLTPLSLAPLPAISTPIISMPLTSPTTSFLPDLAHERATSPLFKASAFAFRSFTLLIRLPSAFAPLGDKRRHHQLGTVSEMARCNECRK